MNLKFNSITVSGGIAVGTSTLAKNLHTVLGWKYYNVGLIQREFDRTHNKTEYGQGALWRTNKHEKDIDAYTINMLESKKNIIYEGWLSGFFARNMKSVLRVLVYCSNMSVIIDRVANRDKLSIPDAKRFIKKRQEENLNKWKSLYGNYDFWDPSYYQISIDTYSSDINETVSKVLNELGYQ